MRSSIGLAALLSGALTVVSAASAQDVSEQRLTPDQFPWPQSQANQLGSGMVQGLQTTFLVGDGASEGLYTLVFHLPPNNQVQPHSHPDLRSCFVLSGLWYFAYGDVYDETKLQLLPPGSHYTEPSGRTHFAATRETDVLVECTAFGPTGTTFVNAADDPRPGGN